MKSTEEKIAYLVDREEIRDLITTYCYSADAKDFELFRTLWTDEIEVDFSEVVGRPLDKIKLDDWVDAASAFLLTLEKSQHIKLPVVWDVGESEATVISTLHARHWKPNETGDPLQEMVGYYHDQLERTPAGWKFRATKELFYWNEGNGSLLNDGLAAFRAVLEERY